VVLLPNSIVCLYSYAEMYTRHGSGYKRTIGLVEGKQLVGSLATIAKWKY